MGHNIKHRGRLKHEKLEGNHNIITQNWIKNTQKLGENRNHDTCEIRNNQQQINNEKENWIITEETKGNVSL